MIDRRPASSYAQEGHHIGGKQARAINLKNDFDWFKLNSLQKSTTSGHRIKSIETRLCVDLLAVFLLRIQFLFERFSICLYYIKTYYACENALLT